MSTETAPVTEAPAAPVAAPVEAAPIEVTPTVEDVRQVAADPANRDALLFGGEIKAPAKGEDKKADEEPVPAPEPEVVPPVEVPPVVPPVETPPSPTDDDDEEGKLPKNFRFHTDDKKASSFLKALRAAMVTNPKVNPADVAKLVGYEMPGAAPAAPESTPEPAGEPAHIVAARAELVSLAQQIKDSARDNLGSDEVEDMRLAYTEKLTDLKTELKTQQLRAELAQESADKEAKGKQMTAREASKAATLSDFPTANDGKSLLGKEITLLYSEIQSNPNHPDRARLAQDDGPRWLTERAATSKVAELVTNLGMTEAQALAAVKGTKPTAEAKGPVVPVKPPTIQQAQPVPRNILVTAPGGAPAPEAVQLDAAQIRQRASTDPKFRDAALGWSGDIIIR